MSYIISLIFIMPVELMVLFNFNTQCDISDWKIVNDSVMGGRSKSSFKLNTEGHGVFSGNVSLENNGGFSSLRYRFSSKKVEGYTKAILKLKGDGKKYQFRVKSNTNERHSYIAVIETTNDWLI